MRKTGTSLLAVLILAAAGTLCGDAPAKTAEMTPKALCDLNSRLLKQLSSSIADADYYFKTMPNGKLPNFSVGYHCPNCNSMHYSSPERMIEEQRPFRTPAYALAPDEFIASDLFVLPEWLDKVELDFQGRRYPAKITAVFPERKSVLLKTAVPVAGIVPLVFRPEAKGDRYAFFRVDENGMPLASVRPYRDAVAVRDLTNGSDSLKMPPNTLIVNEKGEVIALSMTNRLPVDADLFQPPSRWKKQTMDSVTREIAQFDRMLKENLFPVTVRLTPLKKNPQNRYSFSREGKIDSEAVGYGIKLKNGQVLVPLALAPSETARIQKIFFNENGKSVSARFVGSLPYFGGFVVEPEQKLSGSGIALDRETLAKRIFSRVYLTEIRSFGHGAELDTRLAEMNSLKPGFRGLPAPVFSVGRNHDLAVFSPDGTLLALSLKKRALKNDYNPERIVPSILIADLMKTFDGANVPRSGTPENTWLGVEYQSLNPALARANHAAEFTEDGKRGLLVTHVYPDSPAAKMGLKTGDILVSMTPERTGVPLPFEGYEFQQNRNDRFPWEQYDRIPAQYLDQVPAPWGSVKNALNELFGKVGIGGKGILSIVSDGRLITRPFVVSAAPESFDTTEKFKEDTLGLTVCNLTYEVRNYFQLKPLDTGVIVSKVQPGGLAAVAGIKPYEILISVNGEPVGDLASFRKLIKGQTELRIGVRRLAVTRIVTITLKEKK